MSNHSYHRLFRLALAGICFLGVFFFINIFLGAFLPIPEAYAYIRSFISFAIAIGMAKLIWNLSEKVKSPVATYGIMGAMVVGSIGFIGGFVGPIILRSDSPQGPLLGIFFTGPIGFGIGLVGGIFYGLRKEKKQHK